MALVEENLGLLLLLNPFTLEQRHQVVNYSRLCYLVLSNEVLKSYADQKVDVNGFSRIVNLQKLQGGY